jgi:hypothetical protein
MVLPLKNLNAKDIAADVKKMPWAFGELKVLETSNKLILQDTAGNLGRIYEMVKDLEKQRQSQ